MSKPVDLTLYVTVSSGFRTAVPRASADDPLGGVSSLPTRVAWNVSSSSAVVGDGKTTERRLKTQASPRTRIARIRCD